MKNTVIGLLTLLSMNLNAQSMNNPQDVVTGLFVATDEQNWPEVKTSFASQALLDYSSMTGNPASTLSPDAIVNSWKGVLPGFKFTHHQLGNFQVSIDDKTARVFCYGTASHYLDDEGGNLWIVVGSYDFDLSRDDAGSWEITSMKFNFKYQDGNLILPEKAINNSK